MNRNAVFCLSFVAALISAAADAAHGRRGVVATVHPTASQAAMEAFQSGGNAVDAAIAAGLTLGVVDGFNSGVGGGCFMLIRTPSGGFVALDGREQAPQAAHRDMYVVDGRLRPTLSQKGALAIGVPGSVAVYAAAAEAYGRKPLSEAFLRAAEIAEAGFVVTRDYHAALQARGAELQDSPEAARIFLRSDGSPRRVGEILAQTDLARAYRQLARRGPDWFYQEPFPDIVERWMKANGGVIVAADFQAYRMKTRTPVISTYRGRQIVGFPPPSSGGAHVAQILNILEHFDLAAMGPASPEALHLMAEAMKLAFADRAHWLGDPDFVAPPSGLTDKSYGAFLAKKISRETAARVPAHNTPPGMDPTPPESKHTTHFATADAEGYWVACTATVNTAFGSKAVMPGTGIIMNNQMDDFSIQPGVANFFGLIGSKANAVAPGKRPLSSMSPCFVLQGGRPLFSVGGAGGPTIISQAVQTIVRVIDFQQSLPRAIAAPRIHHQWRPDELRVERGLGPEIRQALQAKGHRLRVVDRFGVSQGASYDAGTGALSAATDPRVSGQALAW